MADKPFELKEGQGFLFKNDFKEEDNTKHSKKPDYTGNFKINGETVQLLLWKARTKKGKPMLKIAKKEDRQKQQDEQYSSDDLPF